MLGLTQLRELIERVWVICTDDQHA